jgi:hypothetical protein
VEAARCETIRRVTRRVPPRLPEPRRPLREELGALARHYHQLQNEHKRTAPEGRFRRRIEDQLLDVRARFGRLLDEYVPDEQLREAWREHLHNRRPEPAEPRALEPVQFRGVSETSGSVVELRGAPEELGVWIDGSLVERIAARKDLQATVPGLRLRLDGFDFSETFDAPPEALQALADFLEGEDEQPPWQFARALLADGIVDTRFAVTARGRRALETYEREGS